MALYDSENNRLLDTNDNVLVARSSFTIGTQTANKVFVGENEVKAIYIGNNLVYEKIETLPQLATPVISLSDDILSIEEVENAEYYDIYVDGVLEESVDVRGYKEVTVHSEVARTLTLYDGQDNTGISLGTITDGETKTFHIESGYIVAYYNNDLTMFGGNFYNSSDTGLAHPLGNPCQITEDVSLTIRNSGGSND